MSTNMLHSFFVSSVLFVHTMAPQSLSPMATWQKLEDANAEFVKDRKMAQQRAELPEVQNPSYVVLSCSDSRVTPEYIFRQPIGSFFVIRVAGNIVDDLVTDSIEFAVRSFNPSVIIVMGHSQCGAVVGAIDHLKMTNGVIGKPHEHYGAVLTPLEKTIVQAGIDINKPEALPAAIRANVRSSADKLLADSPIIRDGIESGRLALVGADYNLQTGIVTELFVITELPGKMAKRTMPEKPLKKPASKGTKKRTN